jgi:hypothetical protein
LKASVALTGFALPFLMPMLPVTSHARVSRAVWLAAIRKSGSLE